MAIFKGSRTKPSGLFPEGTEYNYENHSPERRWMTRPTSKTLLLPNTVSRIYLIPGTVCNKLQYCKLFRRNSAVYSLSSSHQVSHLPILIRFFFSAVKQLHKLTPETCRIPNKRPLIRRFYSSTSFAILRSTKVSFLPSTECFL